MIRSSLKFAIWLLAVLSTAPALATTTGVRLDPAFADPQVNGRVNATVVDGSGNVIVAGSFSTAGGASHGNSPGSTASAR